MLTVFHSSIIKNFFMASVIITFLGVSMSFLHAAEPHPEKIWDQELNRWLTPDELGHMEIYFTEEEAAKVMFPDSENILQETLTLTAEKKGFIEQRIGWKFPETSFLCIFGRDSGQD